MAMAIVATVRGIPQIYYGSEIGMAGDKGKGDGDIRHDFPGGWAGDSNNAFTKAGRTATQQQYFEATAKLFNWRKNKEVIHTGKTMHYLPQDNVYVYFRYNDKDSSDSEQAKQTVMVVVNNAAGSKTFGTARFAERLNGFRSGSDVLTGKNVDVTKDITLEGKSVLVLELK